MQYTIIEHIGKGSSSRVFLVSRDKPPSHRRLFVMKECDESADAIEEARLLRSLSVHPCIIRFEDAFVIPDLKKICIVMDRARTDLKQILHWHANQRTLVPIDLASLWIVQVALGIEFLHHQGIAHRDIKPANLLMLHNDGRIVLGDFGASKTNVHDAFGAKTLLGTPFYLSPEVFAGLDYGTQSDVWSFGCVVFEIATSGRFRAFHALTFPELERAVRLGKVQWNRLTFTNNNHPHDERRQEENASAASYERMLKGTLTQDVHKRWTIADVLSDPFMIRAIGRFICELTEGGAGGDKTTTTTTNGGTTSQRFPITMVERLFDQIVKLGLKHTLVAGIHLGLRQKQRTKKKNLVAHDPSSSATTTTSATTSSSSSSHDEREIRI